MTQYNRTAVVIDILKKYEKKLLDLKQVASVCCVSVKRVNRWIEKRKLKVNLHDNEIKVASSDLIDFLIQYNMPIPEIILPAKSKKILFIFSCEPVEYIYVKFLIKFFQKLKEETGYICDYSSYGKDAEYKVLTFIPDLLITDTVNAYKDALSLNEFSKNIGRCKILSIIDKNMKKQELEKLQLSGAEAVVARSIDINDLVDQINGLCGKIA